MTSSKEPDSGSLLTPASDEEVFALWRAGILGWKLWPQQLRIYNIIRSLPLFVQIVVLLCARQFGKSVLSVLIAVEDCLQNPDVVVVIIAPKVEQAEDIVRPRMKILLKDAPPGLVREVKSENTWYFANGSELKLGGYRTGTVSQRGKTLHKVILEEFGADTDADGYLDFLRSDVGPALMHSKNAQMIFPTTLPKIPDHPFITETIPEAQLHGAYFEFTIDDNEALSPEQKEKAIRLAGGIGSIECDRELYCKLRRDPLLVVVPAYDDDFHVKEFDLPQMHFMSLTGDMGGVRDKTCWLLHTYDFLLDLHLIWDEIVAEPNTATGVIVATARERWGAQLGRLPATPDGKGWDCALDAPPRQLVDMGAEPPDGPGFQAVLVPKDDWLAAVNQMAHRFSQRGSNNSPKIIVHPRCVFLRASCRSGTFNPQRTDFARTRTLGHMDALAALMYAERTVRRDSPWPADVRGQDDVFRKPEPLSENQKIADAIQPKSFSNTPAQKGFQSKKFGKFRR